jgi:biopolymer transport protein ExbD
MGMSMNGASGLQSEINVTPLVDVVLVLLIIFIVIMPLTLRGYDVGLAGQTAVVPQDQPVPEQVVLAIDMAGCALSGPPGPSGLPADCRVRVNDRELPVAELPRRLAEIYAGRPPADRVLFLAAQERLNYEGVMRILDLARSGVEGLRIGMVTG